MLDIIRSESRGSADHGWLKAKHTFSFADYRDPARVHFGKLRVINEDRIAPGQGFGTHPHKDMEIVTYVISGAIEHKDSMGNGTVIPAGDVQRMTAGTGVLHSEFNHSQDEELHLLQIWIFPEENNLEPGYEQTPFSREAKLNRLCLIGSRDGREGSVTIHQDVDLYASVLEDGKQVTLDGVAHRRVFIQVVSGELRVNGELVSAGDGVQIRQEDSVNIAALSESEFLLFNLS
ncbi:MAG: pirin family protein [Gammaproteobacteria bacterium]|jgi:redox-sensitive bicupin YhaK (pirin superfamily)|nr:pirin family protein [Gammaproteobacteria bacterium]MDH3820328.1 pirin family protein [Gammaproteobacteria bacterium]MDH3982989.1 pirin family protein [Gammaproteobacteria bacterium]